MPLHRQSKAARSQMLALEPGRHQGPAAHSMTATDKRSGPHASLPDLAPNSNSIAQPQSACRITMAACMSLLVTAVALFAEARMQVSHIRHWIPSSNGIHSAGACVQHHHGSLHEPAAHSSGPVCVRSAAQPQAARLQ